MANITINWRQYFQNFCVMHGNNPVNYRERLLFSDGWMYHKSNYSGPEFAPPEDYNDLVKLQRDYWTIRTRYVQHLADTQSHAIENLKNLERTLSAQLPITRTTVDPDTNEKSYNTEPLEVQLPALENELAIYQEELRDCKLELNKLIDKGANHESYAR